MDTLKRLALFLLGLLVPFGMLFVGLYYGVCYLGSQEANKMAPASSAGAWPPVNPVLFWTRVWDFFFGIPFALHLAVLHNEGASRPDSSGNYPIGDNGASTGPGQIEAVNVTKTFAVTFPMSLIISSSPAALAVPGNERSAMYYSAKILADAVSHTTSEHDAAAYYNGGAGGYQGAQAQAYAAKVDALLTAVGATT
jgi:hypothetical protein